MNIISRFYKYNTMSFAQNYLGGHLNLTKYVTVYGANAMHWAVNVYKTRWGILHIDLPTWDRVIGKRGWCMYASPNGTPWACTCYIGTSDKFESIRADIRRYHFGHNFKRISGDDTHPLIKLNNAMEPLKYKSSFE